MGNQVRGKSLLAALIISNALKDGYDHIFYFDSEGGGSEKFFSQTGSDTNKIEQILVENVEDAQLKILEVYNGIQEIMDNVKEGEPKPRFLCVLDSLGALVAEKVLRDADKGKVTSEMGGRAKQCLPAETLVLMSDNTYKQIKDITPGDLVITHLGRSRPVLDNFKSNHKQYIKIKLKGMDEPIKMSLNHRMLISRNNELMYCIAKDILPTDKFISLDI